MREAVAFLQGQSHLAGIHDGGNGLSHPIRICHYQRVSSLALV